PWGVASLARSIEAQKDVRAQNKSAHAGLYFTVPSVDDVSSVYKDFVSDLKKQNEKAPLKTSAFVSVINLGRMRGRTLQLIGAVTGNGWRELAERLAAMHSDLKIEVVDSPES